MKEQILITPPPSSNESELTFDPDRSGSGVVLTTDLLTAQFDQYGHLAYLSKPRFSGKYYFEIEIIRYEGNVFSPTIGFGTKESGTVFTGVFDTDVFSFYQYKGDNTSSQIIHHGASRYYTGFYWDYTGIVGIAIDFEGRTIKSCFNGVFGDNLSLNSFSSALKLYPFVGSPYGNQAPAAIVKIQRELLYLPNGYYPW